MKKFLWTIGVIFIIVLGISFIMFTLRMIWLPPSSMGMMMSMGMLFHHISFWLGGTFVILFLVIIPAVSLFKLISSDKEKKDDIRHKNP